MDILNLYAQRLAPLPEIDLQHGGKIDDIAGTVGKLGRRNAELYRADRRPVPGKNQADMFIVPHPLYPLNFQAAEREHRLRITAAERRQRLGRTGKIHIQRSRIQFAVQPQLGKGHNRIMHRRIVENLSPESGNIARLQSHAGSKRVPAVPGQQAFGRADGGEQIEAGNAPS